MQKLVPFFSIIGFIACPLPSMKLQAMDMVAQDPVRFGTFYSQPLNPDSLEYGGLYPEAVIVFRRNNPPLKKDIGHLPRHTKPHTLTIDLRREFPDAYKIMIEYGMGVQYNEFKLSVSRIIYNK